MGTVWHGSIAIKLRDGRWRFAHHWTTPMCVIKLQGFLLIMARKVMSHLTMVSLAFSAEIFLLSVARDSVLYSIRQTWKLVKRIQIRVRTLQLSAKPIIISCGYHVTWLSLGLSLRHDTSNAHLSVFIEFVPPINYLYNKAARHIPRP